MYNLATEATAVIAGGADVPFSNNGPLNGVSHPTSTTVTVATAGVYLINYGVSMTVGSGITIAITVNGTVDASTRLVALLTPSQLQGSALITLPAGAALTLRNVSTMALTLSLSPNVSAFINLVRVG